MMLLHLWVEVQEFGEDFALLSVLLDDEQVFFDQPFGAFDGEGDFL